MLVGDRAAETDALPVVRILVVAWLCAWHTGATAQDTPGVTGRYDWKYYTPGRPAVDEEDKAVSPVGGKLFFHKRKSFGPIAGTQGGPRSTTSDVLVHGRVIADKRKLGARVEVKARLAPWDPDAPPSTLPDVYDTSAGAEVVLEDEVEVMSPEVPLGQNVIFDVQPTVLSGSMEVPSVVNGVRANGTSSLTVYFSYGRADDAGIPKFKPIERYLPDGERTSLTLDEFEKFDLDDVGVTVANGARYRFRFSLYVAGGLTPDPSNPKSPPTDMVRSDFSHTATWAGFGNFRDAAGRPLNNVTITSSIGFDWKTVRTTPVPPEVVEYYNASLDHYFITPLAPEQDNLDDGKTPTPWVRTGASFGYFAAAGAGTSPVCRFYIPPSLGDSHFFGRGSAECAATAAKNPSFTLEAASFIHMILPTAGTCPADTEPVYRVFSNRPDANHRYTTSKAIRDQMVAKGWLAEGDGPDFVVMCAPK